ncbi:FKBP-type peptidyl-prolyl cis-trans isomerase [Marinimicrobium alkaliphilum]|uniref:FKBP-type peptidyl-prolyl cis-trans isomerase n=1 Tax=Marinimicrobium alkaliphilum TaxID=2202654 RepID=UPI000DBA05D4|nr:FKBP-type peptidyl-prolyl cis-trans isomerase [Marinimicrobium alkaliphilum]
MINKRLMAMGLAASALVLAGCGEQEAAPESVELETLEEKVNYLYGLNVAGNMQQSQVEIHTAAFLQGMQDARDDVEPRLSEEESMQIMQQFQEQQMARQEQESARLAEQNQAESAAFFSENATVEGVVTTDSGLQYKVVEEGDGASPSADSVVTVHYRGRLLDGTEFDSSYSRNQPATFDVGGVIAGWTEALQLMSEGDKWEIYIPSDLAYGPGGAGPIPPNAALIFEVELLEVDAE